MFGAADFALLDGLRRAHFPPGRNLVPAHLTLFHHLPPSAGDELKSRLAAYVRGVPKPRAFVAGVIKLGRGVAYRIESPELAAIRAELADAFDSLLTPQDAAAWRAHVTIQNKVDPAEASTLHAQLARDFSRRPLEIAGLATWYYRGGPWEPLSRHMFA